MSPAARAARQIAAAEAAAGAAPGEVAGPRLVRSDITLDDGHRVQVTVAGRGIPLVAVHGLSAEGLLYAQSLSRLVASGFKVVAIDTAGHGGTDGLRGGRDLSDYAKLLARVVEHLGIGRAVFLGHSMGGRLVTEVVANDPRRAIAVLLVDAIVGDAWDRLVQLYRFAPPLMAVTGASLALDTITTFPLARNPSQAVKLGKLWAPVLAHNLRRPWQVVAAGWSILRSGSSRWMLDQLADEQVPVFVIHGDRDHAVPLQTARDAANRSRAQLVVVKGATHAWVLRDPETLPAILTELIDGGLGAALRSAGRTAGLDADASIDEIEAAFYRPGARVLALTPPLEFQPTGKRRRAPSYAWTTERPPG